MASAKDPVLREAAFEDRLAVLALQRSVGYMGVLQKDWDWLWRENPACASVDPALPIGWVLEADGDIVGYLGNYPSVYRYGDATLRAATATGFAVDRSFRGFSLRLVGAFFRQSHAELLLNTTASQAASQIFQRFGSVPLPLTSFNQTLFWVLKPRHFAKSFLTRMSLGSLVASAGSYLAGPLIQGDAIIRRRQPKEVPTSKGFQVDVLDESGIGVEFDELWSRKLGEGKRLLANRDGATLRWRLSAPGNRQSTKILACRQSGKLVGYALVASEYLPHLDLPRSRIIDLLVEDDPQIVGALVRAAYEDAKRGGSYVLETTGFPLGIRREVESSNPYTRRIPSPTFLYAAADEKIHQELADAQLWYASPFDGDAGL